MDKFICIEETIIYNANNRINAKKGDTFYVKIFPNGGEYSSNGGYFFYNENIAEHDYWIGGAAEHTETAKNFDKCFVNLAEYREQRIDEIILE